MKEDTLKGLVAAQLNERQETRAFGVSSLSRRGGGPPSPLPWETHMEILAPFAGAALSFALIGRGMVTGRPLPLMGGGLLALVLDAAMASGWM